jgi:hypothetical protein
MPFIGVGEREGAEPCPHIGDSELAARESVKPGYGTGSGVHSSSRMAWQCLNIDLGHCSTGPGPIHYPTVFLFFRLTQVCKIPKRPFLSSKIFENLHECS